jgi:hypothetical protein
MNIRWPIIVALCLGLSLAACSKPQSASVPAKAAAKLGPYGPPMGVRAHVVRSVKVETTGAVTGTFKGSQSDDVTGLMGLCNPNTFANFELTLPGGKQYDEVWVTIWSEGAVGTGATGSFRLDKVEVTFSKTADNFVQREFRGPGKMTLTVHSAAPGNRHMVGTISGTRLRGSDDDQGKVLNVKASFDMDSSCGIAR